MIASADGVPLLIRRCGPVAGSGPVILLGHGPSVHSGLLSDAMQAFAAAGATVWAGDLRGHGGSVSTRAPLAHLDPETGWEGLLADVRAFARKAFDGVSLERRVLVGGGFSGHLMLELLAQDPTLTRHLVIAGPMPRQPALGRMAGAFLRLRSLTRPIDRPDPLILHHIYGFLRAQLPPGGDDFDTISADPAVLRAIREDPRGFPTPTLGYWRAVMNGMFSTFDSIAADRLPQDLRVLVLSGPDDPQTRGGRLVPTLLDWFKTHGVPDASLRMIDGVRANVLIDAPRLPVVPAVLGWFSRTNWSTDPETQAVPLAPNVATSDAYLPALQALGLGFGRDVTSVPAMIDLCYAALDDESRWIALIYRLALGAEDDGHDAERLLEAVYPHWQRAFELREDLRQAAMLGRLYTDLIDRLDLGVAVLDSEGRLRHANAAFGRALAHIDPTHAAAPEAWLTRVISASVAASSHDRPLVWEGRLVGVCFVPESLRPAALGAEPAGRLVVLRHAGASSFDLSHRAGLLALAYGLTGQEGAAALWLAQGLSTEATADAMGISENTLRTHLKQVFQKMSVSSRTELTHLVLSGPLGWLASAMETKVVEGDR